MCVTMMLLPAAGCLRVQPKEDYGRTSGLIQERAGDVTIYDPAEDALVAPRVTALLEGGLTVDEAVRVALLANWRFQAAFAEIGASRADVVQSQLLTNPSIGFSARFPEAGGRSNLMVNFGQELVDLWQIPVKKKIAEAKLEQVIADAARQGIDLIADVKTKCSRVIALRQTEAILRDNVRLIEWSYKLAEDRFKAGETGLLDMNLVRSSLLQVQLDLIGVQRDRRVAESELARALGLSRWKTPWELTGDLPGATGPGNDDAGLIVAAMERRYEARFAAQDVAAAEGELRRQWLNIVPSVMLGAEAERMERRALPGRKILADTARASLRSGTLTAPDIQTRAERDLERRQIIDALIGPTLSVTLPLYDQNQAQIAKARFVAQSKRKAYEALLDQVAQEVQAASATARTAAELVRFYETESLPQARKNLDAAQRSYEAGETNVLALIEAQESLIRQQREFVAARRDSAIAMAELERALGGKLDIGAGGDGDGAKANAAVSGDLPPNGKPDRTPLEPAAIDASRRSEHHE